MTWLIILIVVLYLYNKHKPCEKFSPYSAWSGAVGNYSPYDFSNYYNYQTPMKTAVVKEKELPSTEQELENNDLNNDDPVDNRINNVNIRDYQRDIIMMDDKPEAKGLLNRYPIVKYKINPNTTDITYASYPMSTIWSSPHMAKGAWRTVLQKIITEFYQNNNNSELRNTRIATSDGINKSVSSAWGPHFIKNAFDNENNPRKVSDLLLLRFSYCKYSGTPNEIAPASKFELPGENHAHIFNYMTDNLYQFYDYNISNATINFYREFKSNSISYDKNYSINFLIPMLP